MKVHELILLLSRCNPNMEIIIDNYQRPGYISNDIELVQGYRVTDETNLDERSSFIGIDLAHSICEDGQQYLDPSSEFIRPVLYLKGGSSNKLSIQKYLDFLKENNVKMETC